MTTETTTSAAGDRRDDDTRPLLLSVPEAARLLGVGKTLCWDMVYSGQLPSVRLGKRVLVPRPAIEHLAGLHLLGLTTPVQQHPDA